MSRKSPHSLALLQNLQTLTFSPHSIVWRLRTDDPIDAVLVPNESPAQALSAHTKFMIDRQTSFWAKIDDFTDLCIS
jgi:hypothetical protein